MRLFESLRIEHYDFVEIVLNEYSTITKSVFRQLYVI
jgi:hypothetical protein